MGIIIYGTTNNSKPAFMNYFGESIELWHIQKERWTVKCYRMNNISAKPRIPPSCLRWLLRLFLAGVMWMLYNEYHIAICGQPIIFTNGEPAAALFQFCLGEQKN